MSHILKAYCCLQPTTTTTTIDPTICYFIPEVTTTVANQVVEFNISVLSPIDVDWGDGITETLSVGGTFKSHTYVNPGKYIVKFKITDSTQVTQTGRIAISPALSTASPFPAYSVVTDVKQWGCVQVIGNRTFSNNSAITQITAIDTPKGLTTMERVFANCPNLSYINNIENWDVSNVTTMNATFTFAPKFNQNINNWNVSKVTNMATMFTSATIFNQPLNNWDVSNVTTMGLMFQDAKAFNQPLNNWNTSNVTTMTGVFTRASSFNQPLNSWNVSNVTVMNSMFSGATIFNQPLNNWNVGNVTTMLRMFADTTAFNQPLNSWDVSKVTNMSAMFQNATVFNQPLDTWNTGAVTGMSTMFQNATAFNQPLGNWNITSVTNFTNFMDGKTAATYSSTNLDSTLIGWAAQTVKPNLTITFGTAARTAASTSAYNTLDLAPNNWTFSPVPPVI